MTQTILILIGGGIGSVFRYWMSVGSYALLGRGFPYGTLAVNTLGCFLMGFLTIYIIERMNGQAESLRAFLLIGLLGGFTTFSSFSIETLNLFENGEILKSLLNIIGSVCLSLLGVSLGALLGRQL
jgi:fluoride exporter